MKDYFIGQGTGIIAEFDTLDEMLAEIKRYVAENPGKKYYSG